MSTRRTAAPPSRQRPSAKTRQPVIGVLMAQLVDAYQSAVWRGIEHRAAERGFGVVCFVGSRIDSPVGSERTANVAYGLADPRAIDGLLTVSSAVATFLDARGIERQFASTSRLPQVSVGLRVPGVPSITVDGSGSVAEVIRHIAGHHRRRRFALIGGPPGHAEAEDRVRAFRATLREMQVSVDERLCVQGSFLRASGAEAARALLDRGVPFDALFCANDRMALGAVEVLREAGIRVPEDVAVAGVDGIEEGLTLTPPLTTVIQPLDELGARAVDMLAALLRGESPRDQVLLCVPAIRQSCGCHPRMTTDVGRAIHGGTPAERRIVAGLASLARRGDADAFLARLDAALAAAAINGDEVRRWIDLLGATRRSAFPAGRRPGAAAVSLFELASLLVGETESRVQAARRVEAEGRMATLREISSSLAGAFELPLMLRILEEGLAQLGIRRGYIALFDGEGTARSRLILAAGDGRVRPRAGRFPTARLLPAGVEDLWRSEGWVLEPLVFQEEAFGYILLSGGIGDSAVYDTLREQVSSAIKGALLLEQVRNHERRLEGEVARRTAELTRTNRELTREVSRRRTLEEEVLEVSNRTMQRIGQDLHDDLCQHLAGIAMHVSVLRGAATEPAATEPLERIAGLLEDSIARAKQIARGLSPTGLAEHGLAAAVEELVVSARQGYTVPVEFRAAPDFVLDDVDRALQVYRIMQEALTNALKHSRSERIEVLLARSEGEGPAALVAEVTDFGTGIPKLLSGAGMGLRIMRYRAESARVTLSIDDLAPGTRVRCRIPLSPGGS
jgi:DNA-binding LacI/PurR family transcriptional regulator/signal transduction histidine kinase